PMPILLRGGPFYDPMRMALSAFTPQLAHRSAQHATDRQSPSSEQQYNSFAGVPRRSLRLITRGHAVSKRAHEGRELLRRACHERTAAKLSASGSYIIARLIELFDARNRESFNNEIANREIQGSRAGEVVKSLWGLICSHPDIASWEGAI